MKVSITFHEIDPAIAAELLQSVEKEPTTIKEKTPDTGKETLIDADKTYPAENESGIMIDSLGLPWSPVINTDSKSCIKKTGEWKLKRKLSDEIIEQVRDELRASMTAPKIITDNIEAEENNDSMQIDVDNFVGLVVIINTLMTDNKIDENQVKQVSESLGLVSFDHLSARPDLIESFVKKLNELLK